MNVLNQQQTYEDEYGQYLAIFREVASLPPDIPVVVSGAPFTWVPLLRYLRCQCVSPQVWFPHCWTMRDVAFEFDPSDRTMVEAFSCLRPELVDALWKCDMQWMSQRPLYNKSGPFVITNNGSFHRREVTTFLQRIEFELTKKRTEKELAIDKVVLLPCAADKPFPAPMHQRVLDMLPPTGSWHAMIATGVCGLVPDTLWAEMPWYDSGIPNRWRVFTATRDYFKRRPHSRVILYMDFYSQAVHAGLAAADHLGVTTAVNPVQFYEDYLDLNDPERLKQLNTIINRKRGVIE
jgi:predicted RNA-binding protein